MAHEKFYELTEQVSKKLYEPVNDTEALSQWKTQMMNLIEKISELKIAACTMELKANNTSLDPTDWFSARSIAHRTLDSAIQCIQSIRDQPVWRPILDETRTIIRDEPYPEEGQTLSKVCNDVFSHVFPYTTSNIHPRFWGWVTGEGTLGGILAEMLAATMNTNAGLCMHSALLVERTVIHWMRDIFGFPKGDHGGIVVSGTSVATIICLATARRRYLTNVRQDGIVNGPHLIVYASTEVHMCVKRALELLGLGTKALHLIPVKEDFSINADELKKAIETDRKNGLIPFCIIGSAGTVNTGAFDDLVELSSIARAENIWFHVDGAYGGLVILDPERRHLVQGVEHADSLAFDFHKWLHCPYAAGCALIRDGRDLFSTFSVQQSYLANAERGCAVDKPWYSDLGVELSRPFRALKVWMTLKEHGTRKLGQKIADNCQQAQYLASLLEKYQQFIRVIRPVALNIVNFRVEPDDLDESDAELIDEFNNELLADIQTSGIAVPSVTRIFGRIYIRVCIVSHRSILEDFDLFVDNLLSLYGIRVKSFTQPTNSVH